jgi:ABC-type sugar transport system ATPase subunit
VIVAAPAAGRPPAIRARGVTVRFGAVAALTRVDFDVQPGRVHALVGENGAGKSTLMRVLSGAVAPDEGVLEMDDRVVAFHSPRDARRVGIRMIHQELSLVPGLSVAENIFLGAEPTKRGILDRRRMRDDARALLSGLGEALDPDAAVMTLPLARRELVEIAKALAHAARLRVLILDEPTAILSARETEALFARIAMLRAASVGIVYCSHRLEEIGRIADDVTVLRDGVCVAHGSIDSLSRDAILALMVDRARERALAAHARGAEQPSQSEALRVEGVETSALHDVSMSVRRGEIVALVGLVGAGRTELARVIIGADRRRRGCIVVDGRPIHPRSPRDAAAAGVAYVSEDRVAGALVLEASVQVNMTLARLWSFARSRIVPVVDRARERSAVAAWIAALRIKTTGVDQPVRRLSGGNQQKVVLARWLIGTEPLRVLIVDEPTRGVDAAARADIHAALRELAAKGTAVLAITSDLVEAFALADRLLVMREGRITGSLRTDATTPPRVAALMVPE